MKRVLMLLIAFVSLVFISGCKNQKATLSIGNSKNRLKKVSTLKSFLRIYDKNRPDYKTFASKVNLDYNFDKVSGSNISFSIRMKRDSIIWLSAKYGILKVLLTPSKISFYNKLSKTYGEMTYDNLEKWTKTEMSFNFIQNLIIGDVALGLDYKNIISYHRKEKQYWLKLKHKNTLGSVFVNRETFLLEDQRYIKENTVENVLSISYKYKNNFTTTHPHEVIITSTNDNKLFSIILRYSKVEINHPTKFPFTIPSRYKKIYQ